MNTAYIITQLDKNKRIFAELLENTDKAAYTWRLHDEHWNLLEIICHLYDEECEDFRTRVRVTLETPGVMPPPIHPVQWVKKRKYTEANFDEKLQSFLTERQASLDWLGSLETPKWENAYDHPKYGPLSARLFISNWLAHDYLHIRQITKVKYEYLKIVSGEGLAYAGNWVL